MKKYSQPIGVLPDAHQAARIRAAQLGCSLKVYVSRLIERDTAESTRKENRR